MRPPVFWSRPPDAPGLSARLLTPLGALYAAATALRVARPGVLAGVPVICIGNLNVGGTGKTPTVIALLALLADRGIDAHVLSRGHGGRLSGLRVDPARHKAADVGDEPLLLAAFAPVWIGADRVATARQAVAAGARMLVMDDGFQNPGLHKDLSLIVIDAAAGFGNARVLPAGPLREPVAAGLARADLVLAIGPLPVQATHAARWGTPDLTGQLLPLQTGMDWTGVPVLAFAGIGRPAKFFETLRDLGADLRGAVPLDDHQPLTPGLMRRLGAQAAAAGAQLVTTEKDAIRLPSAWQGQVLTLPVRLVLDDRAALDAALDALVGAYSSSLPSSSVEKSA